MTSVENMILSSITNFYKNEIKETMKHVHHTNSVAANMTTVRGQVLSGTELAREIKSQLKSRVQALGLQPTLAIVQVGGREDSNVYIRMKIQAAADVGGKVDHVKLPPTTTQSELLNKLDSLNNSPNIHGIIVQMPLDSVTEIDSHLITDSVSPSKDVDGLHTINEGRLAIGDLKGFLPCTPVGVLELIKKSGIKIEGADVVVLGRSKIVGTPAAELLKWHHATVTVCHSKTKNLKEKCRQADILVVGIGRPEFVRRDWVKPGAVVIDCGINSIPGGPSGLAQPLSRNFILETKEQCFHKNDYSVIVSVMPDDKDRIFVPMRTLFIGFENKVPAERLSKAAGTP